VNGVYRLERELGRGGMGSVFLAEHVLLRRKVALKVPLPSMRSEPGTRERFEREARLMSRLHHENIVAIYDLRWDDGPESFIAMEFVEGPMLFDYLRNLSLDTTLREVMALVHQISRALDFAHAEKVVHRDLKPTNILVETSSGRAKVMDFGLARPTENRDSEFRTALGMVVGTPGYMAPETMTGKEPSSASDVYSLAVLIYQLLTGELPWQGREQQLIMAQLLKTPAAIHEKNPLLPPELTTLMAQALHVEPSQRPQSAGSFFLVLLQTLGREVLNLPFDKVRKKISKEMAGAYEVTSSFKAPVANITLEAALDEFFHPHPAGG